MGWPFRKSTAQAANVSLAGNYQRELAKAEAHAPIDSRWQRRQEPEDNEGMHDSSRLSRFPQPVGDGSRGYLPGSHTDVEAPRVSVIVPALNEERNLALVIPVIPTWVAEVILVDGNSTDRSVEVALKLRPDIRVVTQTGKGKGDALRAGFAAATGDIIVAIDADGSTDPREIPAFVGALLAGADYAKGSRFMQGGGTADMTLVRHLGHSMLVQLVRTAFGCNFSDLCYGYNAFWREHLTKLDLDADGFEIETLMNLRALRANLKVVEVHSYESNRSYGESHLRAIPDGLRVLRTILRERFDQRNLGARPVQLASRRRQELPPWSQPVASWRSGEQAAE